MELSRIQCCLTYIDDVLEIVDLRNGKHYQVKSQRMIRPNVWHFTFAPTWGELWWGIKGRLNGSFTAKPYKNYRPAAGGSGHNNITYLHNKAMRRFP